MYRLIRDYIKQVLFVLNEGKLRIILLLCSFIMIALMEILGVGTAAVFVTILTGEYTPEFFKDFQEMLNLEKPLYFLGYFLVMVFVVKSILSYVLNYYLVNYGFKKQTELRSKLLHSYSMMPYEQFIHIKSSTMINVIMNYATNFCSNIVPQLFKLLSDIVCLIGLFALLIRLSPIPILVMILYFVIIMTLYDYFIKKKITSSGEISNKKNENIMTEVKHAIEANREMRVLGVTNYFVNRLHTQQKVIEKHQMRVEALQMIPRYLMEISMITSIVFVALLLLNTGNHNSLGILSAFVVAGLRMMPAALNISRTINIIRASRHVLTNLYDVISSELFKRYSIIDNGNDINPEQISYNLSYNIKHTTNKTSHEKQKISLLLDQKIKQREETLNEEMCAEDECNLSKVNAQSVSNNENGINSIESVDLQNVYFKYKGSLNYTLSDVSMKINKGESIGIVGMSGSGKSTLIALILGLLKPTKGSSKITISEIEKDLYGQHNIFAYIPQETFIIDDTISTNVALGVESQLVDLNKVKSALKMAQIDFISNDFAISSKNVGENGNTLSGGQRQRLALARVFYHTRQVIILDEITSALDKKTEEKIIKTIFSLKKDKTFVIVTHSKEMLQACDKVYEVKNGVISKL
jgi:ATP-binding cassette, subfamily B, bacterial PglK